MMKGTHTCILSPLKYNGYSVVNQQKWLQRKILRCISVGFDTKIQIICEVVGLHFGTRPKTNAIRKYKLAILQQQFQDQLNQFRLIPSYCTQLN